MRIIFLIYLLGASYAFAQSNQEIDKVQIKPVTYCVLLHKAGPNWQQGISFQKQPGVDEHINYMRQLFEKDLMVMGGPFLDDSGGIMIYNGSDIKNAKELAFADPAVKSGLLNVEVKLWMVPMSSVQRISKN